MLLYVNCFDDFQEPCIPHQLLTRQQRRSRDQGWDSKICRSCRYVPTKFSKNCHHCFKVETFAHLWLFSCLVMLFLTCRYNRWKVRWIEVSVSHIVAVFKVLRHRMYNTSEFWLCNCCLILAIWRWITLKYNLKPTKITSVGLTIYCIDMRKTDRVVTNYVKLYMVW